MHFTHYDTRLAGYAVIIDDSRRILCSWFDGGISGTRPGWTLPGGGVEYEETIDQAVLCGSSAAGANERPRKPDRAQHELSSHALASHWVPIASGANREAAVEINALQGTTCGSQALHDHSYVDVWMLASRFSAKQVHRFNCRDDAGRAVRRVQSGSQ